MQSQEQNPGLGLGPGDTGDRQRIIERHRQIGDDNLNHRLGRGLLRNVLLAGQNRCAPRVADFAIQLPGDPQQQHAAGQAQADDFEELQGNRGEGDTQYRRRRDAEDDHPPTPLRRQPRRRHADDDGIVAGKHDIDDNHRCERRQLVKGGQQHRRSSGTPLPHPRHAGVASGFYTTGERPPSTLIAQPVT